MKKETEITPLSASLSSISSGRIPNPGIVISKEDLAVEIILGHQKRGYLTNEIHKKLLKQLAQEVEVTLDDKPVKVNASPVGITAYIFDEGPLIKIQARKDRDITEIWSNSIALCDNTLRPVSQLNLDPKESEMLKNGALFGQSEWALISSEIIPTLKKKISVEIQTTRLPSTNDEEARIELELESLGGEMLRVTPCIVYGNPPLAKIKSNKLIALDSEVPIRDIPEEKRLKDLLAKKFSLEIDRAVDLRRDEAVRFVERIKQWKGNIKGDGFKDFKLYTPLKPQLNITSDDFSIQFESYDSPQERSEFTDYQQNSSTIRTASNEEIFKSWKEGESIVPLLGGGFAPLPIDWLNKYGHKIVELLAAKENKEKLPKSTLPTLASLCDDLDYIQPIELKTLKEELENFDNIPKAKAPDGLKATLRCYQQKGSDWLSFLKKMGLGALLADDMGLGKTLQSITIIEKRTLVVAPTSVLLNWRNEIQKFRPSLTVNLYHGANRSLDKEADVTITTYALLRLDIDLLQQMDWKIIILDEGQNIKNPRSQVSKAAFQLETGFKLILTGTPVENSLTDLWSQFNFINPGLLGSYQHFQEHYARPISQGEENSAVWLKKKIKPFVLRRLKTEVAPELPSRTEVTLYAELEEEERNLYNAIYATTRGEIVNKLQHGGNMIEVLEALLRLRQACCHRELIPNEKSESSSKLDLLVEKLETAITEDHKSLVFSQWTSFLDLIEAALEKKGIKYLRLDGSTRNRQDVIDNFQSDDGAPVLIMSLKAGGVGLNLTKADYVFFMDPWWNPFSEDQASDRAYRIGQERPVFIHRIVALDTIEEKILELQKHKRSLSNSVLGNGDLAGSLTKDDLLSIFES